MSLPVEPLRRLRPLRPLRPLQEYFELVEDHLRCRAELDTQNEQLAARAHQFRVVEKRLLVRPPPTARDLARPRATSR